jgi:hypothetical protein
MPTKVCRTIETASGNRELATFWTVAIPKNRLTNPGA